MKRITISIAAIAMFAGYLRPVASAQSSGSTQKHSGTSVVSAQQRQAGEQRFRANCGRCHNAPESISPREVKAVLQHMRVRAMLSSEDEQLILKYLAP